MDKKGVRDWMEWSQLKTEIEFSNFPRDKPHIKGSSFFTYTARSCIKESGPFRTKDRKTFTEKSIESNVFQVCLTYSKNTRIVWFKERFTTYEIIMKTSNIDIAQL